VNYNDRFLVYCCNRLNESISIVPRVKVDSISRSPFDLFIVSITEMASSVKRTVIYPSPESALMNTSAVAAALAADAPEDVESVVEVVRTVPSAEAWVRMASRGAIRY
jgi:hypothetical protein